MVYDESHVARRSNHAHALAGVLDPAEASLEWTDLAVLAAWLVGAALVAVRRFRWEPNR